jgi:hypothetical protein
MNLSVLLAPRAEEYFHLDNERPMTAVEGPAPSHLPNTQSPDYTELTQWMVVGKMLDLTFPQRALTQLRSLTILIVFFITLLACHPVFAACDPNFQKVCDTIPGTKWCCVNDVNYCINPNVGCCPTNPGIGSCPSGEVCRGTSGNFTCQPECPSGQRSCNGKCINIENDPNNCGGCNYKCDANASCQLGQCICPIQGDRDCNGVCVDTSTDPQNCGGCGNWFASPDQTCEQGRCFCGVHICEPNTRCTSCASQAINCGPLCCSDGYLNCGQVGCVLNDEKNCGACGHKCRRGQKCDTQDGVGTCIRPRPGPCWGPCPQCPCGADSTCNVRTGICSPRR